MRIALVRLVTVLPLLLCGCFVSTKPPGDTGFERVENLRAFEGCFANVGEGGKGSGSHYLSAIIWPDSDLDDKSIDFVKVNAEQEKALHVSAIGAGHVIREGRFQEGKDFTLVDGEIKLKTHVRGSAGTEPGNPFIGVGTESMTLGLDKAGNGRAVGAANIGGTVFLVLPVAGHMSDAVRFKRLPTCDES